MRWWGLPDEGLWGHLLGGPAVEKFPLAPSPAPQATALSSSVTNGPLGLGGHQ